MFKILDNKKAQASMGEYAITIAIVMAVIMGMSVFIRRTMQARIWDARNAMVDTVVNRTAGYGVQNIYFAYEPYYESSSSETTLRSDEQTSLTAGGHTGVFTRELDQEISTSSQSVTAPSRDAD